MVFNRTGRTFFSRLVGMGSRLLVFELPDEISFSKLLSEMFSKFANDSSVLLGRNKHKHLYKTHGHKKSSSWQYRIECSSSNSNS